MKTKADRKSGFPKTMSIGTPAPPPVGQHLLIHFPEAHVLHLQINRPKFMNCMTDALEADLRKVLAWFEEVPSLWVLILSGSGKAFCAGQDLKEWLDKQAAQNQAPPASPSSSSSAPPLQPLAEMEAMQQRIRTGGFGGLSTLSSSKPLICAVDGLCLGGGMEILLNMDLVIASSRARFALPEVLRGVYAAQGGIPRLRQAVGHARASEMLLTGRTYSAQELREMGLVNRIVSLPGGNKDKPERGQRMVVREALKYAKMITSASPDSVRVTKQALRLARDGGAAAGEGGMDTVTTGNVGTTASRALYAGRNIKEGLTAFKEKRQPIWSDPTALSLLEAPRSKL